MPPPPAAQPHTGCVKLPAICPRPLNRPRRQWGRQGSTPSPPPAAPALVRSWHRQHTTNSTSPARRARLHLVRWTPPGLRGRNLAMLQHPRLRSSVQSPLPSNASQRSGQRPRLIARLLCYNLATPRGCQPALASHACTRNGKCHLQRATAVMPPLLGTLSATPCNGRRQSASCYRQVLLLPATNITSPFSNH